MEGQMQRGGIEWRREGRLSLSCHSLVSLVQSCLRLIDTVMTGTRTTYCDWKWGMDGHIQNAVDIDTGWNWYGVGGGKRLIHNSKIDKLLAISVSYSANRNKMSNRIKCFYCKWMSGKNKILIKGLIIWTQNNCKNWKVVDVCLTSLSLLAFTESFVWPFRLTTSCDGPGPRRFWPAARGQSAE